MADAKEPAKRRERARLEPDQVAQPYLFATTNDGGGIIRISAALTARLGWKPGQKVFMRELPPANERKSETALLVEVE